MGRSFVCAGFVLLSLVTFAVAEEMPDPVLIHISPPISMRRLGIDKVLEGEIIEKLSAGLSFHGYRVVVSDSKEAANPDADVRIVTEYSRKLLGPLGTVITATDPANGTLLWTESFETSTSRLGENVFDSFVDGLSFALGGTGFGLVDLSSKPVADLYLDGDLVGRSPVTRVRVAPGPHLVRAVLSDTRIAERTVDVEAGKHQSIEIAVPRNSRVLIELLVSPFLLTNIPVLGSSLRASYSVTDAFRIGLELRGQFDHFEAAFSYPIGVEETLENRRYEQRRPSLGAGIAFAYVPGQGLISLLVGAEIGTVHYDSGGSEGWLLFAEADLGFQLFKTELFTLMGAVSGYVGSPQPFVSAIEVDLWDAPAQHSDRFWSAGLSLTIGAGVNL